MSYEAKATFARRYYRSNRFLVLYEAAYRNRANDFGIAASKASNPQYAKAIISRDAFSCEFRAIVISANVGPTISPVVR